MQYKHKKIDKLDLRPESSILDSMWEWPNAPAFSAFPKYKVANLHPRVTNALDMVKAQIDFYSKRMSRD